MQIRKLCFKIDRPNAYAMIELKMQSMWCAVKENHFPMLITLNKGRTRFEVNNYYDTDFLEQYHIPYKYIADLDSQYFIKNEPELWNTICNNGLFNIWDPSAPKKRFDDCRSAPSSFRIQLLRIFEINQVFEQKDIIPVSQRCDHLSTQDRNVTIKQPVMPQEEFIEYKALLKKSISRFLR